MENLMKVPQKAKNRPTKQSSNPTIGHMPGENHNSKRYMHPCINNSTSQDMEAT